MPVRLRVSYARAGVKSAFEKYGLFTLFFARKGECILTNPHSLSTLHTKAKTNRRCQASPEIFERLFKNFGELHVGK